MKRILCLVVYILIFLFPAITQTEGRGTAIKSRLNGREAFGNIIPQKAYVFLVGNDNYYGQSGFAPLRQCYNDVLLLKNLFVHCCKIDVQNVFAYKDLKLEEFKEYFSDFIRILDKESLVIFAYSGHGDRDGSLVFTDGRKLPPAVFRGYINAFGNDTVLFIDACYSGNNEGPQDLFVNLPEEPYKFNSIRIYASLAHLQAKEVLYNSNEYLAVIKPFYRDVLGLETIEGNGFFTAMMGMFFATYKLGKDDNISYNDLIYFITSKTKEYVEYCAVRGAEIPAAKNESDLRMHQLPKLSPSEGKAAFFDQNHNYLLLQNPIIKEKLYHVFAGINALHTLIIALFSSVMSESVAYIPVNIESHFQISGWLGLSAGLFFRYESDGWYFQTQEIGIVIGPHFHFNPKDITGFYITVRIGVGYTWGTDYYYNDYTRIDFVLHPEVGYITMLFQQLSMIIGIGMQSLIPIVEKPGPAGWNFLGNFSHYYLPVVNISFGLAL